jgi:prolyl oligopeptidase
MSLSAIRPEPVEEVIHGVTVRDRYRWLEDRALPATQEWLKEQGRECDRYFSNCTDLASIRTKVQRYLDAEIVDQPEHIGKRYFYRRRTSGHEQACIYVRDAATGKESLLVDPSNQGLYSSVGIHRVSNDGSLLAYQVREGGEDRCAIHFVDVTTGKALPDRIESGYSRGLAFAANHRGFFYCHEPQANVSDHEIQFRSFGKSAARQHLFRKQRTPGSRLILIADKVNLGAVFLQRIGTDLVQDLWIARQDLPTSWRHIYIGRKLPYSPILRYGRIFVLSFIDAPNGRFVELDDAGRELRTVIPESDSMIRALTVASGKIYTSHLDNLISSIRCWSLFGDYLGELDLPNGGTVRLLANRHEDEGFFYTYESFTERTTVFEYSPKSERSQIWHSGGGQSDHEASQPRQVRYESTDGTVIPMTVVGEGAHGVCEAPLLLSTYGGFGISATPQFSILVNVLLDLGAIFALPHIRGGSEFGKDWHDAARGKDRQRSFDDFLAAAEWLCREGITSPQRLAIFGGSNSGLLVAAAMTQRPDLFRAVLCIAPLLDMLRYERFDQAARWNHEYGSIDDPEQFRALHAYSPYHRIEETTNYPAVMFVSGDKDERCNAAHVRKMAARLQERDSQSSPIIVDYSEQRGHFPALPLSVRVEALSRRIAFLCRELGISVSAEVHR